MATGEDEPEPFVWFRLDGPLQLGELGAVVLLAAEPVEGPVAGDGEQPRFWPVGDAFDRPPLEGGDDGVLHEVFGGGEVAGDAYEGRGELARMLSHHARQLYPERFWTVTLGGYGSAGDGSGPIESLAAREVADSLERGRIGPLVRALMSENAGPSARQLALGEGLLKGTNDMHALAATFRAPRLPLIPLATFRENRVPVLLLIGEHDPFRRQAERMADAVNGLELRIIAGADHLGAPGTEGFSAHLTAFLSRHRSGTD